MIQQSQSKIFLAEERGHHELDWFRSYHTFNFGAFHNEHKTPVGPLYLLNDDTLAGGKHFSLLVEDATIILLLPVVGAVEWKDNKGNEGFVEAGQCCRLCVPAGTTINISNPYETELVNFLQYWFKAPTAPAALTSFLFSFDIDAQKNQLVELFPLSKETCGTPAMHHFIGKFDGRAEIAHHLSNAGNGLFIMVIQGAFEVQYRLLHPRDGLALWDLQEAELEALSNDAIIFVTEMKTTA